VASEGTNTVRGDFMYPSAALNLSELRNLCVSLQSVSRQNKNR